MTEKFLVDTNILLFALTDLEKDKQKIAKEILTSQREFAFISLQNIVEFANVISSKFTKPLLQEDIVNLLKSIKDSFSVLNFDEFTVISATLLSKRYGIHFFDALLARTMLENKIFTIYTVNESDFKRVPGIKVINPFKSNI